jgi:urea transporter
MTARAMVSPYAVGLVVLGGAAWAIAGIAFAAIAAACYPSCGSGVAVTGSAVGLPPQALLNLTWDQLYINFYAASIGLFAILVGVNAFRRGEKWAWYAILGFVVIGVVTSVFDYLSRGRWYTGFFSLLPALLGLLLSVRNFFPATTRR